MVYGISTYMDERLIYMVNVGKHTSPIDPMEKKTIMKTTS